MRPPLNLITLQHLGNFFIFTEGRIANLNRILQNLKSQGEIHFEPECFFMGVHDQEAIELLDGFWKEEYKVDETSAFRPFLSYYLKHVAHEDRRGRSYVAENLKTLHESHCSSCSKRVESRDRITIRGRVFHMKCISCVVCGASLRQKADYLSFDGQVCCSSTCVRQYDASHVTQKR